VRVEADPQLEWFLRFFIVFVQQAEGIKGGAQMYIGLGLDKIQDQPVTGGYGDDIAGQMRVYAAQHFTYDFRQGVLAIILLHRLAFGITDDVTEEDLVVKLSAFSVKTHDMARAGACKDLTLHPKEGTLYGKVTIY
jgi:hypothetical protein